MTFLWVRAAFRQLLSTSPPHVAKVESWHMALAWLDATEEVQAAVVAELKRDLGL